MRKFSWGASSCHFPSQLFCLILSKAPTAAKFTVLSFTPDLKRLLFSFPFLLSRHTYTAKCFFPSCPRRLRKCQVFFVYAKDPVKIMAYGSSFFLFILTSFPSWLYGLSPASGPEWGIPCHPKGKLQSLPKLYRGVKKTGWGEAVDFPLHHALLRCSMLRLYLGAVTIMQNQPSLEFQKPYLKFQVCLDKSITGTHSTSRMISVTWEIYPLSDPIFSACSSFFLLEKRLLEKAYGGGMVKSDSNIKKILNYFSLWLLYLAQNLM